MPSLRQAFCRAFLGVLPTLGLGTALEFEEVAAEAGVNFGHFASRSPEKHLVEAMGAGIAMLDFDGDGLLDLYFVNGAELADGPEGSAYLKSSSAHWNRLYRNLGDWRFEDVTGEAGVAGRGFGMGAAVADYDGDGDADLFVSNYGPDILFRNEGDGTFRDVSAEARIEGSGWSAGAAFLDFNNDGLLDLFVASYLEWTLDTSPACGPFLPESRSYCHPREFPAAQHTLYRNLGDGTFEDVSEAAGLESELGKGLGVALNDYDGDGWVDIFVANDSFPQQLFRNARGGRFVESALGAGVAYDQEGNDYAGMGVAWHDYDRDLRADIAVNALGRQGYWLYRRHGSHFEPASEQSGLLALSELRSGWGMGLVDFDNDGWRDLFVAQGHVMDDIGDSDPELAHEEPLMLARNLFGRFYDVSGRAGAVFERKFAARGAAFGDLDGDGRVDVAVSVNDGAALVLQNKSSAGNSMAVRLEGNAPNRDAIGATVRVRTGDGVEQESFRGAYGSYLSSSAPDLHFGLGQGQHCESITVRWPDGSTQTLPDPQGSVVTIRQSDRRE